MYKKRSYAKHVLPVPGRPTISVTFLHGIPRNIGKNKLSMLGDAEGIEVEACRIFWSPRQFHWLIFKLTDIKTGGSNSYHCFGG